MGKKEKVGERWVKTDTDPTITYMSCCAEKGCLAQGHYHILQKRYTQVCVKLHAHGCNNTKMKAKLCLEIKMRFGLRTKML